MIKKYFLFFIIFIIIGVISCQKESSEKSSGLFVIMQGGKYGYIDRTGKVVITPQFDGAWKFSDGMALVKISDR